MDQISNVSMESLSRLPTNLPNSPGMSGILHYLKDHFLFHDESFFSSPTFASRGFYAAWTFHCDPSKNVLTGAARCYEGVWLTGAEIQVERNSFLVQELKIKKIKFSHRMELFR